MRLMDDAILEDGTMDELAPSLLLRHYRALDGASEEMLDAARDGDWDTVCRIEGACTVLIARLRQLQQTSQLPPAEMAERLRILQRIVARDAEVRQLCEPMPAFLDPGAKQRRQLLH